MELILENWRNILILVVIIIIGASASIPKEKLPYEKKKYLLNISERTFFEAISERLPSQYVIYPQIVMSAIIETKTSKRDFWRYNNKINKKIIDFVIFEKKFLQPLLAIEYDGPTHEHRDRMESDKLKNEALGVAGIKIKRVTHSENLDYDMLSDAINSILKNNETTSANA